MDEPEQKNDHLIRAIGQLTVVMAAHLHRQGVLLPNVLADNLGMMAVLSDNDPEAGQIVAYWASMLQDLAEGLQSPPSFDANPIERGRN